MSVLGDGHRRIVPATVVYVYTSPLTDGK